MGGPGSGNRSWRKRRHGLVEHTLALDLRALLRSGSMTPGAASAGHLEVCTPLGKQCTAVRYAAELTNLEAASLALSFRVGGVEHHQVVKLSVTQPHLGGIRLWFVCPVTARRARVLYLPEGQERFASREANRLSY